MFNSLPVDIVSAQKANSVFQDAFGKRLLEIGFEQVSPRKWVRSIKQPVREIFSIEAIKGLSYIPHWGFSLDFVPHISGKKVRWHRTSKSALYDFRFNPANYDRKSFLEGQLRWYILNGLYGLKNLQREVNIAAPKAVFDAIALWDSVKIFSDLLPIFNRQRNNQERFLSYHQEEIAYAFLLALNGEKTRATDEIDEFIKKHAMDSGCAIDLRGRLQKSC